MSDSNVPPLRFDPIESLTVRGDFDGGALSSDVGPLLLRSVDQQIGLTERLAAAIGDRRHPSYIRHEVADLLAQRTYQMASAYKEGNDTNTLRHDPIFQMGLGHQPLNEDNALASCATFSRLEHAVSANEIYRMAAGFVDQFIASYAKQPDAIVLDSDHTDDATHVTLGRVATTPEPRLYVALTEPYRPTASIFTSHLCSWPLTDKFGLYTLHAY